MNPLKAQVAGLATRPAVRAALEQQQVLQLDSSSGVQGDHGQKQRRQVTLLSRQQWQETCQQLDVELPWMTRRANILLDNIKFGPQFESARITIGEITIQVHGQLVPCYRMDELFDGLQEALVPDWRGGVHGEVIHGGQIQIDDEVSITLDH